MEKHVSFSFDPVPGLADVIAMRSDRENLFPTEKQQRSGKPFKPDDSYIGRCAELTELLCRASAHGCGMLAAEIFRDEALPVRLRAKIVPAAVNARIEPFPGRVLTERLLVVYLTPEDMLRERERRGTPVRCRLMSARSFCELAADHGFGARFLSEGRRFDLPRSQFPYILLGAARLLRDGEEASLS